MITAQEPLFQIAVTFLLQVALMQTLEKTNELAFPHTCFISEVKLVAIC